MTHRTHHMAEPVLGRVLVACSCGWTDWVDVSDLPYWEAMTAIYEARDAHETDPKAAA